MKPPDRQTPAEGEIFLDHVGWFVPDIETASKAFQRLGFSLTDFVISRNADPATGELKPAGTGNRCAMLSRGYLELIASIEGVDTPLARQHREALSRYAGVHVIAFTVGNPATAHARLEREGFDPASPVLLRRPVRTAEGAESFAQFTVIRVAPEKMPEGRIQLLTQETPDLVWQPRFLAFENGVAGLGGALLCVEDPARVAARYARFTGRNARGGGEYVVLDLDRGRLAFATPRRCHRLLDLDDPAAPSVAAVALVAADVELARRVITTRGVVPAFQRDKAFCIPGQVSAGTPIIIHDAGIAWPPDA